MSIKKIKNLYWKLMSQFWSEQYWRKKIKYLKKKGSKASLKRGQELIPYINKPGIAFSFDDSFRVEQWYKYLKELFDFYSVRATFNVNAFHHFEQQREHTQKEIDMLIELQSYGHEIAHHGYNHKLATGFIGKEELSSWIQDEIISLFEWMKKQSHSKTNEGFKEPVSFAFPYFQYTNDIIKELVPEYFKIVRGNINEEILIPFRHTGFAPSICIDNIVLNNTKYVKQIMRYAKRIGSNLILTCHSVLPDEVNWDEFGWGEEAAEAGKWRTTPDRIKEIIKEAKANGLEFYTTAEIAGIATFIDINLEKSIRELLKNPLEKWIQISELSMIRELDLSNKNISNLDGIQYFVNLEKVNLSNNNIRDFRLLNKLNKLKEIKV